jgi:tetrahydromethanopterin S-methyltransferase subunit F
MTNDILESHGWPDPDGSRASRRALLHDKASNGRVDGRVGVDGHVGEVQRRTAELVARMEGKLLAAEEQLTNLQVALQSNRRIGMAIGVLMAVRKISENEALELLRQVSSRRNVKLRLVAEDVILTGTID